MSKAFDLSNILMSRFASLQTYDMIDKHIRKLDAGTQGVKM